MVTKQLLALLVMAPIALIAFADSDYPQSEDDDSGPYPALLQLDLPEIAGITVTIASQDVRSEENKRNAPELFSCDDFRVTESAIESYFAHANKISEQDYMHAISWVPCQAFGEMLFSNGTKAQWAVMMSSGGMITFADDSRIFLYCPRCAEPFIPD